MRIGIDVRYLSHGLVGGIHTYVASFVPALVEVATDHQIFLYADTKRPFELSALQNRVSVRYVPWMSPLSSIYHDLFLHRQMARDGLDVVHFPANYGFGPRSTHTVITLHDALNILPLSHILRGHRKTVRTVAMTFYLHYFTRAALRSADLVITVSSHAMREIARYSRLDESRIVPIHHAATPGMRRIEDPSTLADVRSRYGLDRPFILADALKNPAVLVRAWRLLPYQLRKDRQIVFFSRRSDPLPVVLESVEAGDARLLVRPPQRDLIALYSMADVFVFPSWIEGFGLPVLEAMSCGAPVIASDRGSIPEVTGDAALLVDAQDAEALTRHLATVLGSSEQARQLRERGFARAAEFSWQSTARRILDSYEQAVRAPNTRRLGLGETHVPQKRDRCREHSS